MSASRLPSRIDHRIFPAQVLTGSVIDSDSNNSTTVPHSSWSNDLALLATATASSAAQGQPASAAIDAVIGGFTNAGGDPSKEWSSNHQGAGAWLNLNWSQPVAVNFITLYDRPNPDVSPTDYND